MSTLLRPSPFSRTLALVPPLMVLTVQIANGDTFVKFEAVTGGGIAILGESTELNHVGWIKADSLQFGVSNATSLVNGTITGSKSAGSNLVITKVLDRSSPTLFLSCAQGTRQSKVVLEMTQTLGSPQQVVFYRITLTGVIVSSLSTSANTTGDRPTESVSLSYEKITTEYYMADETGKMPTNPTAFSTWSFANNGPK